MRHRTGFRGTLRRLRGHEFWWKFKNLWRLQISVAQRREQWGNHASDDVSRETTGLMSILGGIKILDDD